MLASVTVQAQKSFEKQILGTWHFEAPDAPYEYSTGDIVMAKNDTSFTGTI